MSSTGFTTAHYARCFAGVLMRELLRFVRQRERFVAALVRPLLWLLIFAVGFRSIPGTSIIPPYETNIVYEDYITPGLTGMILLFSGMQSSLSMVYDREMGSMRVLMISPLPRWFLLLSKLLSGVLVSLLQVYVFLAIARVYGIKPPAFGYLYALPAFVLSGVLLGSVGLLLSSLVKQLENFAGVMNFVIFPAFFASSALYPLWRIKEVSPWLYWVCQANPFTHCVELIRFALYNKLNGPALVIVAMSAAIFFGLALWAYDPARGSLRAAKSA